MGFFNPSNAAGYAYHPSWLVTQAQLAISNLRRARPITHLPSKRRQVLNLNYTPVIGKKSAKAERLVEFCIGDFAKQTNRICSEDPTYYKDTYIGLVSRIGNTLEFRSSSVSYYGKIQRRVDGRSNFRALAAQNARFPKQLTGWVLLGDSTGHRANLDHGLHFAGVRRTHLREIVLLPIGDRDRYTGPELASYRTYLQRAWSPWEDKLDAVWWGGAVTGSHWARRDPSTLTRLELLQHFAAHPHRQVVLQPTHNVDERLPAPMPVTPRFKKAHAFSHKCVLLMPGNDAPSGATWYFGGNSVVMMPTPPIEYIHAFELKPWENFLPVTDIPSILGNLDWVLSHPKDAQDIVRAAHAHFSWLEGPEYLWACNEILSIVSELTL